MLGLYCAVVLSSTLALPLAQATLLQSRQQLEWSYGRCEEFVIAQAIVAVSDIPAAMECAWFTVPLDYANLALGEIRLALARVQAQNESSRKGSLLINPGGFLEGGLGFLFMHLTRLQAEAGPDYDLVTFVPRGVPPSGPDNIWTDDHLKASFQLSKDLGYNTGLGPSGIVGTVGNLTNDVDAQFLLSQVDTMDVALSTFDNALTTLSGDSLKYIGTTAVVRDVARIVDALDGFNAPINWLGVSYGTIIGMQLIQLFPDRVGKFILDSVVDPIYWSDRPSYLGRSRALTDADAVYHAFTRVCAAAGPDKCSMLQPNETAEALDKRIRAVLNELYVKKDNATNRVSHYDATLRLFNLIDSDPSGWSTLVGRTSYLIPGLRPAEQTKRSLSEHPQQLTNGLEYMSPLSVPILPTTHHLERRQDGPTIDETMTALSRFSIAKMAMICGDSADAKKYNTQTKEVFEEMIRSSREVSSLFSSIFTSQAFCHKWTSRAVERYTGPWSAKPKNPVLVVSAELDSLTPFRSAQLITTDSFLGTSARLVRIWNFGDSYESDSTCRQSAVFKYLNENVVPQDKGTDGEDVVCPTEFKILGTEPQRWAVDGDISSLQDDNNQPGGNTPGDTAGTRSIAALAVGTVILLNIMFAI